MDQRTLDYTGLFSKDIKVVLDKVSAEIGTRAQILSSLMATLF